MVGTEVVGSAVEVVGSAVVGASVVGGHVEGGAKADGTGGGSGTWAGLRVQAREGGRRAKERRIAGTLIM